MTDAIDTLLFQTILRPHRSLNLSGFRLVMALVAGASAIASLPFVILGFWPVAGFYGLDVLLLFLAFKANYRAAQYFEEVTISPFELLLRKVSPKGSTQEWRFNPAWTRLVAEEHEEFGITHLALVSRGQSVAVGHFLGADDKANLLKGLSRALGEAKRGPFYA
jgi:uncharacterized membrane protein